MKVVMESALNAELENHLEYSKNTKAESRKTNTGNDYSKKTIKGEKGGIELKTPPGREARFEPQIVPSRFSYRS